MAKDEKEGGASSGNDEDDAEVATAATAEPGGTLSLHNTFMDVVIRYVCHVCAGQWEDKHSR